MALIKRGLSLAPWWFPYLLVAGLGLHHYYGTPGAYMGLQASFFFIPVALGAVVGGLVNGLALSLLSVVALAPHNIFVHGPILRLIEMGELSVITGSGVLIGWATDRRRREQTKLSILNAVTAQVARPLELEEMLGEIAGIMKARLSLKAVWISLLEGEPAFLSLVAQRGLSPEQGERLKRRPLGDTPEGAAVRKGEPQFSPAAGEILNGNNNSLALLVCPLPLKGLVLGVLGAAGTKRVLLGHRELVTAIAREVSLGMENALLRRRERQAFLELRASEQKYRELFEKASDAVLLINSRGEVVATNQSACRLTGYSEEELRGKDVSSLLTEGLPARFPDSAFQGEAKPLEGEITLKDGSTRIVEFSAAPIPSAPDEVAFQMVMWDITERKLAQERLGKYIAVITRAQEEERKRIARELHDDTIQALVTLSRRFDTLLTDLPRLSKGLIRQPLEEMWQLLNSTLEGVRRFSQDLRPSLLDDLGLLPAIEWLVKRLPSLAPLQATMEVVGSPYRLAPEKELALFRIVQEVLSNAGRHSRASQVQVKVDFSPEKLALLVVDNGQGFEVARTLEEAESKGQLGLLGTMERAQLIGASLQIDSAPGQGTRIRVELPIQR